MIYPLPRSDEVYNQAAIVIHMAFIHILQPSLLLVADSFVTSSCI
jgi:hypothetical protein